MRVADELLNVEQLTAHGTLDVSTRGTQQTGTLAETPVNYRDTGTGTGTASRTVVRRSSAVATAHNV